MATATNMDLRRPGTYVLILHLDRPRSLTVGHLGSFEFPAGYYAYVGRAFGRGGLGGRLKHHLRTGHRAHWHIDYFRPAARVIGVWLTVVGPPREEQWAVALGLMPRASAPMPGFGASDVNSTSHLFHFPTPPSLANFKALLEEHFPAEGGLVTGWSLHEGQPAS